MKILIAGSDHTEESRDPSDEFKSACKAIGVAIANAGHEIIVGSEKPYTADLYVVQGFTSVKKHPKISIIRPKEGKTPFAEIRGKSEITYDRKSDKWNATRIHQVLPSDVVLLIGGNEGVMLIAQNAIALERPVLAIPVFKGKSEQIWSDLKKDFECLDPDKIKYGELEESWRPEHAELVVNVLTALNKNNPYVKRPFAQHYFIFGSSVLFISLWICIFSIWKLPLFYTLFTLQPISVLIGVNLRNGLLKLSGSKKEENWTNLITEYGVGLGIGFGLSLFFFSGGLVINGSYDFLSSSRLADVMRIGISLSIIGFASGFMIETMSTRLKNLLDNSIKKKQITQ